MNIGFTLNDIIHKIIVKFVPASLPNAAKKYNLKAFHREELDIHDIAMKAAVYNIATSPQVIEDGMTAGFELMGYLAANGFKIKTPIFSMKISVPGQYDGTESSLPQGIHPMAMLQTNPDFRRYLMAKAKVVFDGKDDCDSSIADARDEATGLIDQVLTRGKILTINGTGLKIEGDEEHKDLVGVYFTPETGEPVKSATIALNNPKTLIVHIPPELNEGENYRLSIQTQSSPKKSTWLLKKIRSIDSDVMLTVA